MNEIYFLLHKYSVCKILIDYKIIDRLSGLVVKVPGYRFRGPGSIPGATRFFSEE
jgi:hypothetical protein